MSDLMTQNSRKSIVVGAHRQNAREDENLSAWQYEGVFDFWVVDNVDLS